MAAQGLVYAGSTAYLTVTFRDKAGQPSAPSAVTYRIEDVDTGAEVRTDTSIAAGSSVEITLTPDDTAFTANEAGRKEAKRRVIVTGSYGADDQAKEDYIFGIRR